MFVDQWVSFGSFHLSFELKDLDSESLVEILRYVFDKAEITLNDDQDLALEQWLRRRSETK